MMYDMNPDRNVIDWYLEGNGQGVVHKARMVLHHIQNIPLLTLGCSMDHPT